MQKPRQQKSHLAGAPLTKARAGLMLPLTITSTRYRKVKDGARAYQDSSSASSRAGHQIQYRRHMVQRYRGLGSLGHAGHQDIPVVLVSAEVQGCVWDYSQHTRAISPV